MTKKDYELIAKSINNYVLLAEQQGLPNPDRQTVAQLTGWLANDLLADNSKFNTEKFANAVLENWN